MALEKLTAILGQQEREGNDTLFHVLARSDEDSILDRIYNTEGEFSLKYILVLKNNNGETCLHTAAKYQTGDDAEMILSLLADMGAEWNAQEDGTGDTILHIVTRRQNSQLVEYLLDKGVDRTIQNNEGLTAYQIAQQHNYRNI